MILHFTTSLQSLTAPPTIGDGNPAREHFNAEAVVRGYHTDQSMWYAVQKNAMPEVASLFQGSIHCHWQGQR